jgi:hypothetical protein
MRFTATTGSCNYLNRQMEDDQTGAATVHITVVLKGLFCLPKQTVRVDNTVVK